MDLRCATVAERGSCNSPEGARVGRSPFWPTSDIQVLWPFISRRRDRHLADTPFPSLFKHLLKGEGGAAECQSRRRLPSIRNLFCPPAVVCLPGRGKVRSVRRRTGRAGAARTARSRASGQCVSLVWSSDAGTVVLLRPPLVRGGSSIGKERKCQHFNSAGVP